MSELFRLAQRHLEGVFDNDGVLGTSIVVASRNLRAVPLVIWTLTQYANCFEPHEGFKAVYVTDSPRSLDEVHGRTYKDLRGKRPDIVHRKITLLSERLANPWSILCCNPTTFMSKAALIRPKALDLLIVDERSSEAWEKLAKIATDLEPDLTVAFIARQQQDTSVWAHRFGEPLLLSGTAHPEVRRTRR